MNGISVTFKQSLLLFLSISFSLLLATVPAPTVLADTVGPAFSQIYPVNGTTVNQTQVVLSLIAHDTDNISYPSLVMKVDGVAVKPSALFASIDEWTEDYTTLEIYYPATLAQGDHTVYVAAGDGAGNLSEKTWSFTVNQPPEILTFSPANGATVVSKTPEISAKITSGDQIDRDSILMTLNGAPVPIEFDPVKDVITYNPEVPLENEAFYNVALSMKAINGDPVKATWQFYINTFQEMSYAADDETCQKCHDRLKHVTNDCIKCHGINQNVTQPAYPIDDCYGCHLGTTTYPPTYHSGLPVADPPSHPVQEIDSCVECHNQAWSSTAIPPIHNVFDTAVSHQTTTTGCTNCHAASLTREHQRRLDDQGNPLNCFTCHNSTKPKVKEAIAAKNSSCSACHSQTQHPEHNNGLDIYCQSCHSSTILTEPQFHAQNSCDLCHGSSDPLVKYNMDVGNTSCFACHDEGHNVNFVQKVPEDIPLFPDFQWSIPQNAALWSGEAWFPQNFASAGAKFLLTNHRTDITGTEVYNWYTDQLSVYGWNRVSGPAEGSDHFTLSYEKGLHRLNVIVHTGADHDPSSAYVGLRIELLYK